MARNPRPGTAPGVKGGPGQGGAQIASKDNIGPSHPPTRVTLASGNPRHMGLTSRSPRGGLLKWSRLLKEARCQVSRALPRINVPSGKDSQDTIYTPRGPTGDGLPRRIRPSRAAHTCAHSFRGRLLCGWELPMMEWHFNARLRQIVSLCCLFHCFVLPMMEEAVAKNLVTQFSSFKKTENYFLRNQE